jgi:hypothetical protein
MVRREGRQCPICAVCRCADGRGMACVVAELEADLDPFGRRRRRCVCGRCPTGVNVAVRLVWCSHPGLLLLPRTRASAARVCCCGCRSTCRRCC